MLPVPFFCAAHRLTGPQFEQLPRPRPSKKRGLAQRADTTPSQPILHESRAACPLFLRCSPPHRPSVRTTPAPRPAKNGDWHSEQTPHHRSQYFTNRVLPVPFFCAAHRLTGPQFEQLPSSDQAKNGDWHSEQTPHHRSQYFTNRVLPVPFFCAAHHTPRALKHTRNFSYVRPDQIRYHCVHIRVAVQTTTKVGIREFRENLADYLESKTPVAITRHGATIGIYVPTKPQPS